MAVLESPGCVQNYRDLVDRHLTRLNELKQDSGIEPALAESDVGIFVTEVQAKASDNLGASSDKAHYALIETVFRERFNSLLGTESIDEPSFTQVWNLLDVIAILSDYELCEPGLIFWLVEELLDSQIIEGCRKVFDYLESRRERITAKHFQQKNLIILRSCNELLRRLSRAEDTVFCGRVFIFLFQSFPLGDKSSVNLRGEFHIENVTVYDEDTQKSADAIKPMELDVPNNQGSSEAGTPAASSTIKEDTPAPAKVAVKSADAEPPSLDVLYPVFWAMQVNFSCPTRLFQNGNMKTFKDSLSATLECFQKTPTTISSSTNCLDEGKRGIKRKQSSSSAEFSNSVQTKYLTNRDLFDLEIHDLAFRRHILVQALIILDFLLSLTPAAKQKISASQNKAVQYTFTLSDTDTTWAQSIKSAIATYLQQGPGNEGKMYYRMVDTVLSRDRNWVRWKADQCPAISRPPVTATEYLATQTTLKKVCTKNPLSNPMGATSLDFFNITAGSLESLQDAVRFETPTPESFYKGIMNDELDAEMGTDEEKKTSLEARESKLWRALRASKNKFGLFDRIDNGKNPDALLQVNEELERVDEVLAGEADGADGDGDGDGDADVDADGEADGEADGVEAEEDDGKDADGDVDADLADAEVAEDEGIDAEIADAEVADAEGVGTEAAPEVGTEGNADRAGNGKVDEKGDTEVVAEVVMTGQ